MSHSALGIASKIDKPQPQNLGCSHLVVSKLFKMIFQISHSITNKAHQQNSSTDPIN